MHQSKRNILIFQQSRRPDEGKIVKTLPSRPNFVIGFSYEISNRILGYWKTNLFSFENLEISHIPRIVVIPFALKYDTRILIF